MGSKIDATYVHGQVMISTTTLQNLFYKDLAEIPEGTSADAYIKDFIERIDAMKITKKEW